MEIFIFISLFIFPSSTSIIHLPFFRIVQTTQKINPETFPLFYFETNYYVNIVVLSINSFARLSYASAPADFLSYI